jgi:histidinol-phosphate aminotransferase
MKVVEQAHEHVKNLVPYEPGKPIEDVARDLGLDPSEIIKLASNENPLGPSPKAVEAMKAAVERAHFYPDGGAYYLREAIARKFGLKRENIVLGNGSNEIIELLGHAFLSPEAETITSDHAFVVYKLMSTLFGARTLEIADPGFVPDLEAILNAITPRTRQIFLANPNNPTGTMIEPERIEWFMERVPEHVIVVFDEAYYEFMDNPADTLRYIHEGRNVVIMRTFSKSQGLSGLRIGYAFAPEPLATLLHQCRQPFNVNAIAQAGALAALDDEEHQARTKAVTDEGREYLQGEFTAMGLEFTPSYANFVLVNVGDGDMVFRELMKKGIIVRAMRGYKLPERVRVSIGTMEQNRRFISELKKLNLPVSTA